MRATTRRLVVREAIVVGVAQAVAWLLVGLVVVRQAKKFEGIVKDFGVDLPVAAQVAIATSELLAQYWYCGLVLLLALPAVHYGFASLVGARPEPSVWRPIWFIATWLAPLAALLFAAVAIGVPYVNLLMRLQ